VRPALRTEELLEASALMDARQIFGRRMPRPSELACLLLEFHREVAIPDLPALLLQPVLALVGAWRR
jgi:hypothetical protein